VKNFSVIKEAEFEFGKITVLIGPQSSGKSLLCKLAYFLGKEVLEEAVKSLISEISLEEFKKALAEQFVRRFTANGWVNTDSYIEFSADRYKVRVFGMNPPAGPIVSFYFSSEFESEYDGLRSSMPDREWAPGKSRQDQEAEVWTSLNLLLSAPFVHESIYIPSGRVFFTSSWRGFSAVQNPDIDPLVSRFGPELSWGRSMRRIGQLSAGDGVLDSIKQTMDQIAGGEIYLANNVPTFKTLDGRHLPLGLLSSGTQELLPLFNILGRLASNQEGREMSALAIYDPPREYAPIRTKQLVYVEEPEANVFPSTQYDLVRLFSRLSYESNLDFSWVITTHSPYILSSFNNLIEAGQVAAAKPELKEKLSELIPEHFWVKPGDFKAYAIEGGFLNPIVAEDTGLVSSNYLDQVSETIGAEFDELLRLGYVEA
jgi:hypothetical protein